MFEATSHYLCSSLKAQGRQSLFRVCSVIAQVLGILVGGSEGFCITYLFGFSPSFLHLLNCIHQDPGIFLFLLSLLPTLSSWSRGEQAFDHVIFRCLRRSTHHHIENRGFQVSETEIVSLLSKNKGKGNSSSGGKEIW